MLEQLLLGLKVTVLGIGTVFSALVLLILFIEIMHKVVNGKTDKNKEQPSSTDKAFERVEKMEEAPEIQQNAEKTEEEDELIAVISAAVAAALNRSTHDILVKSVTRIPNHSPAWNRASRQEQIGTRL